MTAKKLRIRFDGPEIHPHTVDALKALEVVSAYLAFLQEIARSEGQSLSFTGIEIIDECTLFKTSPSEPAVAETATRQATAFLSRNAHPPQGTQGKLARMRDALAALPAGYTTTALYGTWHEPLVVAKEDPVDRPYARVSLRAVPIRVGGMTPTVHFRSGSELRRFTLTVTEEQARTLGASLYNEVDIVALVARDHNGFIQEGTLEEFHTLDPGDPRSAWEAWFKANAEDWEDVEDVEHELGRHGS